MALNLWLLLCAEPCDYEGRFQILYILASHPGQAYSKERLYELIWKEPYFGNENVLNTHINRLRLKLKSNAEDSTAYVKTLWGIGYKMEEK